MMTSESNGARHASTANGPRARLQHIGRYELVSLVGQGGMASVYIGRLACLAGFEKLVAVKVIHPHLVGEREFVSMFLDEARIAACIQHPNVAAITEMGEDDGLLYMVGELVQGESLRSVMRRVREEQASFPHVLSAYIVAKMCDGLHAAHELTDGAGRPVNLVHRDVSPQNVLVSYSGHVKLIDFGVAQARDRITHTQTGTIKGKIGYLSPEQLRGVPLDARSDVFSAGVVLYQLLTGTHPFPGDSDLQRLDRIARAEFRPPREQEPSVPANLERIVVQALARDPAGRFPSAAAMAQALGEAVRSTGERVGSARLSTVMKLLFSQEIADRAGCLEVHRERYAGSSAPGSPSLVESQTNERWITTGSGPGAPRRGATRARRGIALAVSALLLSAAATLALVLFKRADHGPPVAVSVTEMTAESAQMVAAPDSDTALVTDVRFEFSVSPAGARLLLDGKPLAAGVERLLVPGDGRGYRLTAQAPGHRTDSVIVVADGDRLVAISLEPLGEVDVGDMLGTPGANDEGRAPAVRKRIKRKRSAGPSW
ncbi:MAG TPA: serine/threonine-protein kinase, partial [Polyangia bacterium]|nr:serine/threonine-protein kinase [Polyangia bacterium]